MLPHCSRARAPAIAEPSAPFPRLVLDTNVVLDWVAFGDPRVRSIVAAIEGGALQPMTSAACLEELRRALGYPEVKLDATAQALAFARYSARATRLEIPLRDDAVNLPQCEDPDDQKFLQLAWHAGAACLVTRDKALLKLARRVELLGRFRVLAPHEFDPSRI